MAVYRAPADDDPVAAWVAQLNYLGQLCDEQAAYEGQFEPRLPGQPPRPISRELQALMGEWKTLAAKPARVSPTPLQQLPLF